jgi:hypothetical protein
VDHALYENVKPENATAFADHIKQSLHDPQYGKKQPQPDTPEWNG